MASSSIDPDNGDDNSTSAPVTPPTPSRVLSTRTPQQVEQTSLRALQIGLGSNVCYLLGAIGFVVFGVYELQNRCPDFPGSNEFYLLGFVGFLVSGFIQLYLDLFLTNDMRSLSRSRYNRKNFWTNITVSLLFTVGNIFDLVSFFLWHTQDFRLEHRMLFTAAYSWLITSILVLITAFNPIVFEAGDAAMRLDAAGNWLFFFGNVLDVVARHLAEQVERQTSTVYTVELISSALWLVNAILFLGADSVRVYIKMLQENDVQKCNSRTVRNGSAVPGVEIDAGDDGGAASQALDSVGLAA